MSIVDEVEHTARVMGWQCSRPVPTGLVMWRGGQMIDVTLTARGQVSYATRFEFVRLDNLHFKERVFGKHKKATILSWLATDW